MSAGAPDAGIAESTGPAVPAARTHSPLSSPPVPPAPPAPPLPRIELPPVPPAPPALNSRPPLPPFAGPADPAGRRAQSTRAAGPAVAQQWVAGITAGPAGPAVAARRASAGPAGPAVAQQPRSAAIAAGLPGAGRAGAASAAVAEQPPAGRPILPRPRGPVGAVADQRAPVRSFTGENTARLWAPCTTACSGEALAASASAYELPAPLNDCTNWA